MKKNIICLTIFLLLFIIVNCVEETDKTAVIAIYSGESTAEESVRAAEKMFEWMGYSVGLVQANLIKSEGLHNFSILCIPGGDMYRYTEELSSDGIERIKSFISNGGGYIGICGGAYFAGEKIIWQDNQLPMNSLGLFQGTCKGPIDEIAPYPGYDMCKINVVDSSHFITKSSADSAWMLYYWGPMFVFEDNDNIHILGKYDIGGGPMMLCFEYGNGRVFIIGTHPEIEEDSDRDGQSFADSLDDRGSDWDIMKRVVIWCLEGED
jgi:glutamine amidotransferase-like uncharacterized protein